MESVQGKPLPRAGDLEAPAPRTPSGRIAVESSPTRCPFCHDGLDHTKEQWLACAGCLARHHHDCWVENGRCGSCASEWVLAVVKLDKTGAPLVPRERTVQEEPAQRVDPTRLHPSISLITVGLLLAFLALPALVGVLAAKSGSDQACALSSMLLVAVTGSLIYLTIASRREPSRDHHGGFLSPSRDQLWRAIDDASELRPRLHPGDHDPAQTLDRLHDRLESFRRERFGSGRQPRE